MKTIILLLTCCISTYSFGQTQLTHGAVYGSKPNKGAMLKAGELEAFMGKKTTISTTVKGTVLRVTKSKGGWFEIDGGNGKIIAAHFKTIGINLPMSLKGHTVIAEGTATKQFIADDGQHFAGDTVVGKKQHSVKTNPKQTLTLDVTGLEVE